MRTCPRCQEQVRDDARFCMTCGAPLEDQASPQDGAPEHAAGDAVEPAVAGDEPTDLSMPVAESPTTEVSLTTCPQCGAANAVRRSRCGRCDAPLRTADPTAVSAAVGDDDPTPPPSQAPAPVRAPLAADSPPTSTPTPPTPMDAPTGIPTGAPPRRRGWLVGLVVVLLGVVVGTGVGVAAGLGLGPFASDPPLPTFAPASYVDDPQPLRPTFAGASSQRPAAEGRAFGPELTADGDLATAWMTDEDGARLRHTFETPVWITSITLANGDQAEGGFDAHGRLREATVDLGNGQRLTVTFQDTPGEQQVTLPSPRITDEITWTVNEVVGGDDLAVAEVRYSGYVANEEDRQAFPDE